VIGNRPTECVYNFLRVGGMTHTKMPKGSAVTWGRKMGNCFKKNI